MKVKDDTQTLNRTELRNKRLDDLLQSCQDNMLGQVIGPLGLNSAMFNDQEGGNVTTEYNFSKGVVATEEDRNSYDEYQRAKTSSQSRKDYDKAKDSVKSSMVAGKSVVEDSYTGGKLKVGESTTQLDHVVAVNDIETRADAHLFMDRDQRVEMASQEANLKMTNGSINASMQDTEKMKWAAKTSTQDKTRTNAEFYGIDDQLLATAAKDSRDAINKDLQFAQLQKQGKELASAGAEEAGRNALKQAIGIMLHEVVTGMVSELKHYMKEPRGDDFIDKIIAAFKRVAKRAQAKFKDAGKAGLSGGIEGFASTLLTFLINSLIKTSAKVVSIIREGIKGLWEALKILAKPPEGMSAIEVSRQASKIIAAVITTSLGMAFEESLNASLIAAVPFLAPIMDILSPIIAGILTGTLTALVIYGLDRFFDWLSSPGTELLETYENNLGAMHANMQNMADWIQSQYQNSTNYQQISQGYLLIECQLGDAQENQSKTIESSTAMLEGQVEFNKKLNNSIISIADTEKDVMDMLAGYILKDSN